jgi:hypothetical protein
MNNLRLEVTAKGGLKNELIEVIQFWRIPLLIKNLEFQIFVILATKFLEGGAEIIYDVKK